MNVDMRFMVVIAATTFYILIIATIPIRLKYIAKRIGEKIFSTVPKKPFLNILTLIFSALLIVLLFFRDAGLLGTIVICLVAIIGAAMGSEELALLKKSGVYKNGILFGGNYIPLNEIYALQFFYNETEDKYANEENKRVLKILTNKRGTITLIYASEEECRKVVNTLKKLSPTIRM
ncbi:MAG: hypothetical protein HDR53_08415 [Treponema sp.]|nr:hypothetical protein [Treponema sp.]